MEKKIKIAFDIDGVLINFNDSFLDIAKNKFGVLKNVTRDNVVHYNYWECIDISKEKCFEIVDYVLENPFECGVKPIKGAVESLTHLSKYTDLLLVTARQERFIKVTKDLIYSILPNVDKSKITILHESGRKKYKILKDLGVTFFVDDKLSTCQNLVQNGINVILFDSPWNQSNEKFYRTNCWKEISNFIFKEVINNV